MTCLGIIEEEPTFVDKKCTFNQNQMEYLGHIISKKGVAVDPQKIETMFDWSIPKNQIETMFDWSIPKNLKALKGILGLPGYYN